MLAEELSPTPAAAGRHTVDDAAEALIEHKRVQGVSDAVGGRREAAAASAGGWRLAAWLPLRTPIAPKTPGAERRSAYPPSSSSAPP